MKIWLIVGKEGIPKQGGIQDGRILDNVSARYARNKSNIISYLCGAHGAVQHGDFEQYLSSVSDSDTNELSSDKSESTFHVV